MKIRNDVIDIALVKDTIAATFLNRGTDLRLIQMDDAPMGTIQKYWDSYLRALTEEVKRDLSADFREVINEINQNSIRFNLIESSVASK